ncbi:MAG: BLUF domain-containing protein [Alcaligenaceae bacterium]|nr:MAG: BLUF domain-containing protein [Alcaligenaceae bacterium]
MLSRLIYRSKAALISPSDISDILRVSQTNNAVRGITGAMLFSDGWFVQYLEGGQSALDRLQVSLRADARHSDVRQLDSGYTSSRIFTAWSMTLVEWDQGTKHLLEVFLGSDAASLERLSGTDIAAMFRALSLGGYIRSFPGSHPSNLP